MYDYNSMRIAKTLPEALAALAENPKRIVLCGGTDVLLDIRAGKAAGCDLLCVRDIPELQGIREENGALRIGPSATFFELEHSPLVRESAPMLAEAASVVGGPQIRKMGTVGGNVCNGKTSADSAPSLFALDALLTLASAVGERTVPIADFYKGPGKTDRHPDELLTCITIPAQSCRRFGEVYIKSAQRAAMDIATISCAAAVALTDDKAYIAQLRLAYGVAAPVPARAAAAEAAATGLPLTAASLGVIADAALEGLEPRDSWRASRQLRRQLIHELAKRGVRAAAEQAGGVFHD